ncbi:MAG TPA: hypothetical protein VEL74_05650 [Thermoanaerobaculia bacterium]|nr:hypothetical protein [Thermoanaerobaculia bacterium]
MAAAPVIPAPADPAPPIGPISPIGPIAAAPAPVVPDPEPLPEGDVLSSVDDDLLAALAPTPPPPPPPGKAAKPPGSGRVLPFLGRSRPAPAPAPAAEGQAAAPDEAVPAVPARGSRPLLLGVAAALLLIAALAVLWIMLREPGTAAPPPPVLAAAPRRPPQPPAAERLEQARLLVAEGEDDRARQVLRTFTAADEAALPPSACRVLDGLRETLLLAARDRLPDDLTAGLEGDLARLRSAVDTGVEQPALVAALPPAAQAGFDRARRAMELYLQAEGAARDGDHPAVLEHLGALVALAPQLADPEGLRAKSAEALEAEAGKLVEAGRYPEALAKLEPLRRTWPERSGLAARVASYEGYQKDEAEQKRILEAIPAVERRRKPHEGLEVLAAVKPTPHLAPEFAQARGRLENLLAQLDRQPPQVVLRDGYGLSYSRGSVVTLSFRATDDYEVKSVKLMLRPPGGKMRSMAMETTRQGHTIEIPPSLHQNGTVEFYVTATDRSGHEGSLGTAAQPMKLTREQGFERIVR